MSFPAAAHAADTMETWEAGAFDLELYGAIASLGGDEASTPAVDLLVGYGVVEGLSAWAAAGVCTDAALTSAQFHPAIGLFGAAYDGEHVDVDLALAAVFGDDADQLRATAFAELNLDAEPDRSSLGAYVRGGVAVHGFALRDASADEPAGAAFELEPGAYAALAAGHELLVELDLAVHMDPAAPFHGFDLGGLELGYNVRVAPPLELVTAGSLDLPQGDEAWAGGASLGFIATIDPPPAAPIVARRTP